MEPWTGDLTSLTFLGNIRLRKGNSETKWLTMGAADTELLPLRAKQIL